VIVVPPKVKLTVPVAAPPAAPVILAVKVVEFGYTVTGAVRVLVVIALLTVSESEPDEVL
jgi:hypothetical protein